MICPYFNINTSSFPDDSGGNLKLTDNNVKGWKGGKGGRGGKKGGKKGGKRKGGKRKGGKGKKGTEEYAKNGEKAHNVFRKIHEAPDMKMNSEMSKSAEEYAKKLAASGSFQHSNRDERKGDGENLAMKCSSKKGADMTAEEATKNW